MRNIERVVEHEYALYLVNTDEWVRETSDDRIWIKTDDVSKRFTSDYRDAINVLYRVANDKHLKPYIDIQLVEVKVIHQETYLEFDKCAECERLELVNDLHKGVVDRETGVELFCEDCIDEVDLIIGNQPLDEVQ